MMNLLQRGKYVSFCLPKAELAEASSCSFAMLSFVMACNAVQSRTGKSKEEKSISGQGKALQSMRTGGWCIRH